MGCGCKKKKLLDKAKRTITLNSIRIVDGEVRPPNNIRTPDLIQPPVDQIIDKLNNILTPK